ncbi:MAG: family 20 glycosylhydrolase [Clostridia bacterium]|nr:family 20 glycosylhydrolase [Clostridia bacterium]
MTEPFAYRGFMLDVARHYMPVAEIRRVVEAAALCGMNRMHWHLTDDQGWRIEIKRYPRLTEVGSVRGPAFFGAENENENNAGFYTQEEIRGIVAFARERGVEIVPEIEVPGHASAMLAAYPEFGCRREIVGPDGKITVGRPSQYWVGTMPGVFPNLICAGRDEAVRFLEDILDEVADLFPGPEIHIGGDEAIKQHWRRCPDCQRRIREERLADENELQRWLVLEIGDYLAKKGKRTIVWNESLDGGLLPDHFIVQHWLGNDRETAAFLAAGGQVISSETEHYYISRPYSAIDVHNIWQAPEVPEYAREHPENLLGIECPMWSERVTNEKRAEYLLFPRVPAVALKAGRQHASDSWEAFRQAVGGLQAQVERLGVTGAPERVWKISEEDARAELDAQAAMRQRPEMQDVWRICDGLLRQEKLEKLLFAIGMPRPYALRVMDFAWTEVPEYCGEQPEKNGDGADEMARQLITALDSRADGAWKDLPEDVWLDTLKCFSRFVAEHYRSTGAYAFDRFWWTTRQIGARLFRIGELEYELREEEGKRWIALHIPSDTHLTPAPLNDSVARARSFLKEYFPEWAELPMQCSSWLMSPKLRELLPADANIPRFQRAFDITRVDAGSNGALGWVFQLTGEQQKDVRIESLPENTTLQRRVKALLLAGGAVGAASGVLAREFE